MPLPTSGAWGAGSYPDWYNAIVQSQGFTPQQAEQFFTQYVQSHPTGPDGNPIDFGPEWNAVGAQAPGGNAAPPPAAGQAFGPPTGGDIRTGPGGTPSGPDPNKPGGSAGGAGGVNPAVSGGAGWSSTVPTRPTAPPNGAGPGSWVLRGNNAYGYQWQWNEREHRTPPADALPPGFNPAPPQPPPPPVDTNKPPAEGPPLTGNAPPPVDPFNYYSVAHTGPRQGGAGPGGPQAGPQAAGLQPNRRPRPPVQRAGNAFNRPGTPGQPIRPSTISGGNQLNPQSGYTYKRDYDL